MYLNILLPDVLDSPPALLSVVVVEDEPSVRESSPLEREMLEEPMSHIPGPDPPSLLGPLEQTEEYSDEWIQSPSQNKPSKKGRSARQVGGAAVAGLARQRAACAGMHPRASEAVLREDLRDEAREEAQGNGDGTDGHGDQPFLPCQRLDLEEPAVDEGHVDDDDLEDDRDE